jgi:hypothetical protein
MLTNYFQLLKRKYKKKVRILEWNQSIHPFQNLENLKIKIL